MSNSSEPNQARATQVKGLVDQLSAVYRAMTICTDNLSLEQQSLPARQQAVVFLLARNREGMYTKDLAKALGVTSSAATQLIDVLVQKGLAQRTEDKVNRRLQLITLTKTAATGFSTLHETYLRQIAYLFDVLSDKDIDTVVAILSKVKPPAKDE